MLTAAHERALRRDLPRRVFTADLFGTGFDAANRAAVAAVAATTSTWSASPCTVRATRSTRSSRAPTLLPSRRTARGPRRMTTAVAPSR